MRLGPIPLDVRIDAQGGAERVSEPLSATAETTRGTLKLWVTPSGAVGMEYQGRSACKQIQDWVALAWGDLRRTTKDV